MFYPCFVLVLIMFFFVFTILFCFFFVFFCLIFLSHAGDLQFVLDGYNTASITYSGVFYDSVTRPLVALGF